MLVCQIKSHFFLIPFLIFIYRATARACHFRGDSLYIIPQTIYHCQAFFQTFFNFFKNFFNLLFSLKNPLFPAFWGLLQVFFLDFTRARVYNIIYIIYGSRFFILPKRVFYVFEVENILYDTFRAVRCRRFNRRGVVGIYLDNRLGHGRGTIFYVNALFQARTGTAGRKGTRGAKILHLRSKQPLPQQ